MKATIKSVAKGVGVSILCWIVAVVVLFQALGVFGALLATVLVGGGFLVWLMLDHPEVGSVVADLAFDIEPDGYTAKRAEQLESDRLAQDHIDRTRRGNPRDST